LKETAFQAQSLLHLQLYKTMTYDQKHQERKEEDITAHLVAIDPAKEYEIYQKQ